MRYQQLRRYWLRIATVATLAAVTLMDLPSSVAATNDNPPHGTIVAILHRSAYIQDELTRLVRLGYRPLWHNVASREASAPPGYASGTYRIYYIPLRGAQKGNAGFMTVVVDPSGKVIFATAAEATATPSGGYHLTGTTSTGLSASADVTPDGRILNQRISRAAPSGAVQPMAISSDSVACWLATMTTTTLECTLVGLATAGAGTVVCEWVLGAAWFYVCSQL